jgi:uncharacterized protein YqgQ
MRYSIDRQDILSSVLIIEQRIYTEKKKFEVPFMKAKLVKMYKNNLYNGSHVWFLLRRGEVIFQNVRVKNFLYRYNIIIIFKVKYIL